MGNQQNPSYKLTGINPLAYMGVEPYTPPGLIIQQRRPNGGDNGFNIGQIWVIRSPQEVWMLVQLSQGVATWVQLYPGGGGGGASSFPTNIGTATSIGGVLNVKGANVVETLGAGNTVTVQLTNGSNGQIPISGGASPIWANITAGAGVTVTNAANSITIAATGGEGVNSIVTNSGSAAPVGGVIDILGANLINTSAAGNIITVALNKSNNGQIPIGSTGNPTVMANIISSDNTITVTNGSNSIDLSAASEVNPAKNCNSFVYMPVAGYTLTPPLVDSIYYGQYIPMTILYDVGSNWYVGSGGGVGSNPATFTAPATGIYIFGMNYLYRTTYSGSFQTTGLKVIVNGNIATPLTGTQYRTDTKYSTNLGGDAACVEGSVIVQMNSGDVATFLFTINSVVTTLLQVTGSAGPTNNIYSTAVWSYRVV